MNFEIPIPPELVDAIAELVAQRLRQLELTAMPSRVGFPSVS